MFAKVLQQPDFPETVLTREKARIISGLQEAATQPESISNKAFMAATYGAHPYSLDESGEVETVGNIKREDLQNFYNQDVYKRQHIMCAALLSRLYPKLKLPAVSNAEWVFVHFQVGIAATKACRREAWRNWVATFSSNACM